MVLRDTSGIYCETIDGRLVHRVDPVHYCIALHLILARDRIASSSSSSRRRRKIEGRNVAKFSAKRLYGYMDGTAKRELEFRSANRAIATTVKVRLRD